MKKSIEQRFWDRVDVGTACECWNWKGGKDSKGYPLFWINGKTIRAYRFIFDKINGPIPADMTIDHICRNHGCVNPDHLRLLTRGENVLIGVGPAAKNARKTTCKMGHPLVRTNYINHPNYRHCPICRKKANHGYGIARRARAKAKRNPLPLIVICFFLSLSLGAWSTRDCWRNDPTMYIYYVGRHSNNAGGSVRWHVTIGSTPITGKTPGASEPLTGTSILPGVFNKAWPLLPSSVRGCSRQPDGYDHRTTATLSIEMIQAQMYVESRGDWGAVSREKCIGSMQISPVLAKEFGMPVHYLDHPILGMEYGIRIMEYYWVRWYKVRNPMARWELCLSSYNAGFPRTNGAYRRLSSRWRDGVPHETRRYIERVMKKYHGGKL